MAELALETLKSFEGQSAREFLVHREPMLLLDTVIFLDIESAICEWEVSNRNRFRLEGLGVPAYVGVEYMAQCIAIHAGALARTRGDPPPVGFLLGSRKYEAKVAYFDEGVKYRVSCRQLVQSADGMGSFDCEISHSGQVLAKAQLAVLEGNSDLVLNV